MCGGQGWGSPRVVAMGKRGRLIRGVRQVYVEADDDPETLPGMAADEGGWTLLLRRGREKGVSSMMWGAREGASMAGCPLGF